MNPVEDTLNGLQKELADAEADIQAALHSMRSRVVDVKIVTHQRRDRADESGRPGFFRQDLTVPKHIEAVLARADQEKTTQSLNHKNWGSVINALMDISGGCVDDGNKIALRVDSLKNVLRTMHLLQRHLMTTAAVLPQLPSAPPTQAATPALKAVPVVIAPAAPVIRKPSATLEPTPPEGSVVTQEIPSEALTELESIRFLEESEEPEGEPDQHDDADTEDTDEEEDGMDDAPEGSWQQVS